MDIKYTISRAVYSLTAFGVNRFRKDFASFYPGKIALKFDKNLISKLKEKRIENSIVIVGTNGKTTVTNLIADLLESQDNSVICNRIGANLDSGITVSLVQGKKSKWGVFECDEFNLFKIALELKPNYIVLTNIFPDQLDRLGSVSRVQENIIHAIKRSSKSCVIYNGDDPNCQYIVDQLDNECISFGVEGSKPKNRGNFVHTEVCPECGSILNYTQSTYDQLGSFSCDSCSFKSKKRDFLAKDIEFSGSKLNSFSVYSKKLKRDQFKIKSKFDGLYTIYNLTAICALAAQLGIKSNAINKAISKFESVSGRYEFFDIAGKKVFTNLAKNPAGFNQNLSLLQEKLNHTKKDISAAFFVNNNPGDGKDYSWIWSVDFEQLRKCKNLKAFVGGTCADKLQERLRYARIPSVKVETLQDVINYSEKSKEIFALATYTALPSVYEQASKFTKEDFKPSYSEPKFPELVKPKIDKKGMKPLRIASLYSDILDMYSDQFNSIILKMQFCYKEINAKLDFLSAKDKYNVKDYDIILLGEGSDKATKYVLNDIRNKKKDFKKAIDNDKFFLCIGKSFRIFGKELRLENDIHEGLDILDIPAKAKEYRYNNFYGTSEHGPVLFMNNQLRKEIVEKLEK
ncbi:MAG: DUF1727 domain-containing protein [Enterococcus sp.]|nr:DUF1727 domain-containing protein [Enterococcus sp.]